jgi:hypothetical protein
MLCFRLLFARFVVPDGTSFFVAKKVFDFSPQAGEALTFP